MTSHSNSRPVEAGDFVKSLMSFKEQNINAGDRFFIAGTQWVPVDEKDIYLQRMFAYINRVDEKGTVSTDDGFVIDPRSLRIFSESEVEELALLEAQLDLDFGEDLGTDATIN